MKQLSIAFVCSLRNISLFWPTITALLLATGCKKELQPAATDTAAQEMAAAKAKKAPVTIVQSGQSIQAAINAASPGDVLKIEPGTYLEALTVNKENLTLIGASDAQNVILQNPGGKLYGITVGDAGDGFVLKNMTIRGFDERGTNITYVDGFLLSHVNVIDDGEFGFFVEYCKNGVIQHCEGSGLAETAVFVGYSRNVLVSKNKAYENVIGFESENSSYITFDKNKAYNNSVGILCLLVPGRDIKESKGIVITKNHVDGNNLPNFSLPPEKESVLPSGVGILNVGTDDLLAEDNHVVNNQFTGIATVSSLLIALLSNIPPEAFADIEPNPDRNRIVSNVVKNNGYNAPPSLPLPGVDLLWDGSGTGNCWKKNVYSTSYPSPLPACP